MSPTGMMQQSLTQTPQSEDSGDLGLSLQSHLESGEENRDCKVVKEKVRLVVGDLENVLGELKTMVGDLKVLCNQIDVVTDKIDEEYGVELRTNETEPRRKSASAVDDIEDANHNKKPMRHSTSQAYDNVLRPGDWPYMEINNRSRSPSKRSDRLHRDDVTNSNGSGHKKRNGRSSDTSGCVVSSRGSKGSKGG